MSNSGAQPLSPLRWLGLPLLQVVVATFLFALPLRFWGLSLPEPIIALPVVFAWAVIRPSMLAPLGVMIMGLFLDLLWGGPLGLWAVCLLLPYGLVLGGRAMLAGQGRLIMWAWFCAATALALGAGYLLTTLDARNPPNVISVGWQFLATILLYPFSDRLIGLFEDADVRFR